MISLIANGIATLVSGTVTINTPDIQKGDVIIATINTVIVESSFAHCFSYQVSDDSIIENTSFIINSLAFSTTGVIDIGDNSTVNWLITRS